MKRIRILVDEAFKYEWGPLAVAAVVVLSFMWCRLWLALLAYTGVADAVNGLPGPVKVVAVGVLALAVAVACLLRGAR